MSAAARARSAALPPADNADVARMLRDVLARLDRIEGMLMASRKGGRPRIDTAAAEAEVGGIERWAAIKAAARSLDGSPERNEALLRRRVRERKGF